MNKINENNFRQIVEAHKDRVYNTCYKFLRQREDAEDAAQETFIEIYRSLSTFRGEAQLSTWIHRIAVSKSLDIIRKRKRKKRLGSVKQLMGFNDMHTDSPLPEQLQPDQIMEESERRKLLYYTLDKLTENQRIALTLTQLQGFSYQETAEIMDTSVSSIESLIFRAKKNLKKKLCKEYNKIL